MAKSATFENQFLLLIFNGTTIPGLAENLSISPDTQLYLALHTADPTSAGNQTSHEAAYPGYSRVAVPRSTAGFTVNGNQVTLAATVSFPQATTGANESELYFSVGVAIAGATEILYSGAVAPSIPVLPGIVPQLTTGTNITET